jgi:DNA ligase 1
LEVSVIKPILAHIYEPKRWSGPCYVQPKFDGIRALYQAGHFQSRNELPVTPTLLKHLTEPLKAMFPDERVILDGELYVHGWPLGRINGAVTPIRQQPNEDTLQVEYYVFDRVQFNVPFYDRFMSVHDTIKSLGPEVGVQIATTMKADTERDADAFYAMCVNEGFEGIMYRLGDCPYTRPKQEWTDAVSIGLSVGHPLRSRFWSDKNNRTQHLLKRKDFQDDEFECVAVEEGQGKRRGMVGALVCELLHSDKTPYFPQKVFRVGTGLTEAEAVHYFEHQPIGRKVKVKFRCWTADNVPFNPSVIAILCHTKY